MRSIEEGGEGDVENELLEVSIVIDRVLSKVSQWLLCLKISQEKNGRNNQKMTSKRCSEDFRPLDLIFSVEKSYLKL